MNLRSTKCFAMLALLLVLLMCLPAAGVAESKSVEQTVHFTGNETLSFWFSPIDFAFAPDEIKDYLDTNFICDWDENGSIEADELNEHISAAWSGLPEDAQITTEFGKYGDTLGASIDNASPNLDGLRASITLTNKDNGNTFTVNYTAVFNGLVKEEVTIDTQGTITGQNGKQVNLEAGQTATITVNHHYDGDQPYTLAYQWVTDNEQNQVVTIPGATGSTYTFTMEDRQVSQLSCEVYLMDESGNELASSTTEIVQFNLKIPKPAVTLNVETSHPVVDNMMTVTEGDTVTIALNPTCEDPEAELSYYWSMDLIVDGKFVESFEPEGVTHTYTFTATDDLDGWYIYAEVGGSGLQGAYIEYKLVVEPKAEAPEAETVWNGFTVEAENYSKLVQEEDNLCLYVIKGTEVTVKADYAYTGTDELESYWHFTNWETGTNKEVAKNTSEYTFTFENEGNLMFTLRNSDDLLIDTYVYLYSVSEEEVKWTLGHNEQTNLLHMIGANTEGVTEYLDSRFFCDWNADGKVELDEIKANVAVSMDDETGLLENAVLETSYDGSEYLLKVEMTGFSSSCDGKVAVLTLENKNGDTYTLRYVFEYAGYTVNPLTASSDDAIEVEASEYCDTDIIVKAQDGTSITFTDNTEYEASEFVSCEYEWAFYDPATGEEEILPFTGKECTVIKEKEGTLFCWVKLSKNVDEWKMCYYAADLTDLMPKATAPIVFNVVTTPAVVDDVITVTEGETVTINTNASCADTNVNIHYFWAIDVLDENGEIVTREKQDNPSPIFSFTATMEHNGKWVRAVANCLDMECESAKLLYQLKVEPKQEEPVLVTIDPETSHQVVNDVLTVAEGETVTVELNASCTDLETEIGYYWSFTVLDEDENILEENAQDNKTDTFSFVAAPEHDGKWLYAEAYPKSVDGEYASLCWKLVVTPDENKWPKVLLKTYPEAVDGVMTVKEKSDLSLSFEVDYETYSAVKYEYFLIDPVEGTRAELVPDSGSYISYWPVTLDMDGFVITARAYLTDEAGTETWTSEEYEVTLDVIPGPVYAARVTPEPEKEDPDSSDPVISVYAGDTVTAAIVVENPEQYTGVEVDWFWIDNNGEMAEIFTEGSEYSFTALPEHNGWTLNFYAIIHTADGDDWDTGEYFYKMEVLEPESEITITCAPETIPAAVDGVITAYEGDTVTINTNAVCSDPSIDIEYTWTKSYADSSEPLEHAEASFSFTAIKDDWHYATIKAFAKAGDVMEEVCSYRVYIKKPAGLEWSNFGEITSNLPCRHESLDGNASAEMNAYFMQGASASISAYYFYYDEDGNGDLNFDYGETVSWYFENASGQRTKLESTTQTCQFTFEEEGKLIVLVQEADGTTIFEKSVNILEYKDVPIVTFAPDTTPAAQGNVITVTEGDEVIINTNATCSDPDNSIWYEWYWGNTSDGNGMINYTGSSYRFIAKAEHNNRTINCTGEAVMNQGIGDSLQYQLVVLPRPVQYKVVYVEGIPENALTDDLKANANLNTPEKVEAEITEKVQAKAENSGLETTGQQTSVYEVTLMHSTDGGETFVETTEEFWPESGKLTVTLPYPEGTDRNTVFVVAHMFTETTADHVAGDVEYPAVTNTDEGITFEVSGLSPVALAWVEAEEPAPVAVWNSFIVESTGDVEVDESAEVPAVYAVKGDTLTITADYIYEDAEAETVSWFFYNWDEGTQISISNSMKSYSFIFEDEGNLMFLAKKADGTILFDKNIYIYEQKAEPEPEKPVITLDVKTSHPVQDGVLTMTEGDTVTVELNPTCTDPSIGLKYYWSFDSYDENGNWIEDAREAGEVLTFTATMDLNGKNLYAEVYSSQGAAKADHVEYELVVVPKTVEPDEELKVEIEEGLTADSLSEELKAIPDLNTPEKVEADITIKVLVEAKSEGMDVAEEQTAVYDVTLMYSEDGGKTFVEATKENWPASGRLTVTLPYPEGTGKDTHTFVVAHMFTQTTDKHKAGDIEYPAVTNTDNGIQFEVTGLSPIAVAWETAREAPAVPPTGDSATPCLWLLGMLMAGAGCVLLGCRRRQNG